MALVEELIILGLLLAASVVAQPLSGPHNEPKQHQKQPLMEPGVNGSRIEYSNAYPERHGQGTWDASATPMMGPYDGA